jgi:hypothetical protein
MAVFNSSITLTVTGVNPVTSVEPDGPPPGIRALDRNDVAGVALLP